LGDFADARFKSKKCLAEPAAATAIAVPISQSGNANLKDLHWAVAVANGIITSVEKYSVYRTSEDGRTRFVSYRRL
jgi:hypothetical protein